MATLAAEKAGSRKAGPSGGSISFIVTGTDDIAKAVAAAYSAAEPTWAGLYRDEPTVTQVLEKNADEDIFFVDVAYVVGSTASGGGDPASSPSGTLEWSGSTTFESVRIKQSLQTIAVYPTEAPKFNGLINVSGSALALTAEGVEIPRPVSTLTCTYRAPESIVTPAWRRGVESIVGTVCSSTFQGRPSGEVLFAGFTDRQTLGASFAYEFTMNFQIRPNADDLSVGAITGIAKKGHEFLWVYYGQEDDAVAKQTVAQPVGVYIEELFPVVSWSILGTVFGV